MAEEKIEPQAEAEETQVPEVPEEQVDPVQQLRDEVAQLRTGLEDKDEKIKDLGSRLTRSQQETSELTKFAKNVSIPQANKSFEEKWEESPEQAVREVARTEAPHDNSAYTNAMNWINGVSIEDPDQAKYRGKVVDMGKSTHGHMTWSEQGIRDLYSLARREDEMVELEKLRGNNNAEAQKTRAHTESSTPRAPAKLPAKISAQERRVAEMLNLKPEDYIKQKGKIRGD